MMRRARRFLCVLPLWAAVAALPGCSRKPAGGRSAAGAAPAVPSPTPAAAGSVVAIVNGVPITSQELDLRAADRLAPIRQQEYETRRRVLDEIVSDQLVAKEAAARGLSPADFLRQEVDAKADPVTPDTVAAVYEKNKSRFAGLPKGQALQQVEQALRQQSLQQRDAAFRREIVSRASVIVHLEAPRQQVLVPPGSPTIGPATAPLTVVEFTDYECPYCQRAEETVSTLLKEYSNRIRFVHADFPLSIHDRAFVAARASRCADEQGRFWDYRRSLFATTGDFSDDDFKKRAAQLGLQSGTFATCLASSRHDDAIRQSMEQGESLGVYATPTFFINGRLQRGAAPIEEFRRIVEEELARAKG